MIAASLAGWYGRECHYPYYTCAKAARKQRSRSWWQDPARNFPKTDAIAIPLTPPAKGHAIAVLQETALLPVRQGDRFAAAPAQLQHAPERVRRRPTDGARCQEVARVQIAAVDRMVRHLLRHVPVEVLAVRVTNGMGLFHFFAPQFDL